MKRLLNRNAFFMISLQRILILLRSDITNDVYLKFLSVAKDCFIEEPISDYRRYVLLLKRLVNGVDLNQYEEHCLYVTGKDRDKSSCDNWSVIKEYIPIITSYIDEIFLLTEEERFEQSFDLVDMLHALPEALLLKQKWDEAAFIRVYINPYKLKWQNHT